MQPVFDRNGSKGKKFFEKIEDSQEVANAPKRKFLLEKDESQEIKQIIYNEEFDPGSG